jgi:hypothetical protein
MKKLILTATVAMMICAAACGDTAPKSNGENPQTSTTETAVVDDETAIEVIDDSPKGLAQQYFDLVVQLEGRDSEDHDPAVVQQLEELQKKIDKLSEVDQKVFDAEVFYLYTGEEYEE